MYWKDVTCETCGARYRDFRAPDQPSFAEAYSIMLEAARELAASGDYSKPARRSCVLGYMHEHKRSYWQYHLEECAHYADQERGDEEAWIFHEQATGSTIVAQT